jgi:cell division protein FtsL
MTAVRTPPATRARATAPRPAAPTLRRAEPRRAEPRRVAPRVVPASARHTFRRLLVLAVVVGVAMVFAAVVLQALLVSGQGSLDDLERRIATQEQLLVNQQLEITRLESPTRVVGAAQERLGMAAPTEIVYLRPSAGDDQTIAAPYPAPATNEPVAGADG